MISETQLISMNHVIDENHINIMKTIKFKKLRHLCFCDSEELLNKIFIINKIPHEWIGIGMVECDIDNKKEQIVVEE